MERLKWRSRFHEQSPAFFICFLPYVTIVKSFPSSTFKDMKVFFMYSRIAVLVVLVLYEIYQLQEIIKVSWTSVDKVISSFVLQTSTDVKSIMEDAIKCAWILMAVTCVHVGKDTFSLRTRSIVKVKRPINNWLTTRKHIAMTLPKGLKLHFSHLAKFTY